MDIVEEVNLKNIELSTVELMRCEVWEILNLKKLR